MNSNHQYTRTEQLNTIFDNEARLSSGPGFRFYLNWHFSHCVLQVVLEASEFTADVGRLDTMDFVEDLGQDYVLARRLEVAK